MPKFAQRLSEKLSLAALKRSARSIPSVAFARRHGPVQVTQDDACNRSKLLSLANKRKDDASSRSTLRERTRGSCAIAKDALLLSPETLAQSADAFPPLKSVIGGLLFLTKQLELISSNKAGILEIYARIDSIAASLVRAVPDVTMLSRTARIAIHALVDDIQSLCTEIESLTQKRPLLRFIHAQQTRKRLEGFSRRLNETHASFIRTLLVSTETKSEEILTHVHALQGDVRQLHLVQANRDSILPWFGGAYRNFAMLLRPRILFQYS